MDSEESSSQKQNSYESVRISLDQVVQEPLIASVDLEDEEKALNLITFDQKEGFQVSPEAIELLRNVKDRIGVIAVAGKYRTGKSFLLNRILLNKKDSCGFGVGPTINPCTKGLWIWNKPIEVQGNQGEPPLKVFIIDSEGIGAFNEDQNHDTRIFLLALLLSSYFVYNSMGTIDENALQNLSLIVNLSKQLQIKNQKNEESDPDEIARYFPSFMWVVRDFALRLLDQYGNSINSKEYLENALKEQKGTSDNVEKKNRIRRLVLNFFKDRDCYTMVRPTEEEKDLQALQTISDEKLRPEFLEQMMTLRQRIFKRVKPKVLNGKFINGEMFIELCQAYTTAINKGSVPCIESAWTYLCQNENGRAVQEAIQNYENQMRQKVFLNPQKSECVDYPILKQLHLQFKNESLAQFKEKAVGQSLTEFEAKITEEISKKYLALKQKCLQLYDVDAVEKQIRQDLYPIIQDFQKDLEKLKLSYTQLTAKITYVNKELVIKNISEKLILKAFESIQRKDKETLTNQNRALQEKVNFLEKDLQSKKQEYDQERMVNQSKFLESQSEMQTIRSQYKLLEERSKMIENERNKLEVQLQEKVKTFSEQKDKIEQQLSQQLKEAQQRLRDVEEKTIKSSSSFEKEFALQAQKLTYVEKDNQQLLEKIQQLTQDNRNLIEKFAHLEQQSKLVDIQLKVKEEERRRDVDSLKDQYEKKLNEIKSSDSTVSVEKQKIWEKEKSFLQEQLQFSQKQIEENKKLHDMVIQALNNKTQDKEQDTQVIQINKTLSDTISKIEAKNQQLQQKLNAIKIFQRVFKHSQSMQCKFCQVFFPSEIFIEHVKSCNKDNRYSRSHFFQIPLSISIIQTLIKEDPVDNRTYTEYAVQINFNNKTWVINQKYKTFCNLHEKLINQYPNIKFPQSSFQFAQKNINEVGSTKGKTNGGGSGSSTMIEDRRKMLQQYLQDLALIPAIKESVQFKQFIGIQDHFPEFWDEQTQALQNILNEQSKPQSNQSFQSHQPSFKLMNDLFTSKKQKEELQKLPVVNLNEKVENALQDIQNHYIQTKMQQTKNRYSNSISSGATPQKEDLKLLNIEDAMQKAIMEETQEYDTNEQTHKFIHNEDDDVEYCERDLSSEKPSRASLIPKQNNNKYLSNGLEEFTRNLYQKSIDKQYTNENHDVKKSISQNNLMCSPHMFGDKHSNKIQGQKENCIACKSKQFESDFFRESYDDQGNRLSFTPNGHQKLNQNRVVEVNTSYQNLTLLDELVRKSGQKHNYNKHDNSSSKRDHSGNMKDNLQGQSYLTQMRSDKMLSDININQKTSFIGISQTKTTTPVKKGFVVNQVMGQKSPYGQIITGSQQSITTPMSLSTTPDQLKRNNTFEYQNQNNKQNQQIAGGNNGGGSFGSHGAFITEKKGYLKSNEKLRKSASKK